MKVKSESEVIQSCPTLSNPMDCSLPGSSIHGIFQARVLEWVAIAISKIESLVYFYSQFSCVYVSIFKLYYRDSCLPMVKQVDKMGRACMPAKLLQLCLTLRDPMDCSLPGSYVLGIIQARILEWDAMPSSRGFS